MGTRLTAEQCLARAHALEEAADHLHMSWTDDRTEYEQGIAVAALLRTEADRWRVRGLERFSTPSKL